MSAPTTKVGLRIDVDTFVGTKEGVPALCALLAEFGIKGTFYFTLGPDNMGRHIYRLIKPQFLLKMLRSRAAKLYGWDILLCGVFWPGPQIGARLGDAIRQASDQGHEIGFHAWDHHHWQWRIDKLSEDAVTQIIKRGCDLITKLTGKSPSTSAAPGWRCTDEALKAKAHFGFKYNSDCRGDVPFVSVVGGEPQLPVNLPTYDEVIGRNGITDQNYNQFIFSKIKRSGYNVLTIHTEVEGRSRLGLFRQMLEMARAESIEFVALGALLDGESREGIPLPQGRIVRAEVPGREGWISHSLVLGTTL